MNTLRIASDRSSDPLPAAPPPQEPSSDPLAAPAHARPRVPAPPPVPPARPPAEPLSVSGPRKVIVTARHIAALLEREPSLWPGLTACVTDVDGRMIVHYAVLTPGGTEYPAPVTGPESAAAPPRPTAPADPADPAGPAGAGPAEDTAGGGGDGGEGPPPEPLHIPSPDPVTGAVPTRWRMLLAGVRETHRIQGREHVTVLRGIYAGLPVTVLFTVLACG
jgi:hypothetical protein